MFIKINRMLVPTMYVKDMLALSLHVPLEFV